MESLWIGYALASKVLKNDLKWLKRRFAMLEDILRDTPVYYYNQVLLVLPQRSQQRSI